MIQKKLFYLIGLSPLIAIIPIFFIYFSTPNYTKESEKLLSQAQQFSEKVSAINIDIKSELKNKKPINPKLIDSKFPELPKLINSDASSQISLPFVYQFSDTDRIIFRGGAFWFPILTKKFNSANPYESFFLNGSPLAYNPFTLKDSQLILTFNVKDFKNNLIVSINENKIFQNKNYSGQINYDNRGFEVLDSLKNVAFSVDIKSDTIIIQGYFVPSSGIVTVIGNGTLSTGDKDPDKTTDILIKNLSKKVGLKKLFDYSTNIPGMRNMK